LSRGARILACRAEIRPGVSSSALLADRRSSQLLMRFLVKLMRGLHYTIGISTPPPEQERFYVFVWLGIGVLMVLFFLGMLYVMQ
jgi:hypothetical protein